MGKHEVTAPALPIIRRYGHPHRGWLIRGLGGTFGVVFFRLAMPWPLRAVMESAFPGSSHRSSALVNLVPSGMDAVVWFCAGYLLLSLGIGVAEMVQRTCMGRFASYTVRDLRASALRAVSRRRHEDASASGDLISRLVGDAGRLKTDLHGIFVHASQDGLLFLAICGVFLAFSPEMALFFLVGGVLAIWIGYATAVPVAKLARKQRAKEGAYAATIQAALQGGTLAAATDLHDDASAVKEDGGTALVTRSTLVIHVLVATTVASALWIGVHQVQSGTLAPGQLFLFVAYALTVHRRVVQLGRQLARMGKVRASVARIAPLLDDLSRSGEPSDARPLQTSLRLDGVGLGSRYSGERRRIDKIDLTIEAGSKVAILGHAGDGKSSLLSSLAGLEAPSEGTIYWNGTALNGVRPPGIAYLPQDPAFLPTKVWQIFGLAGPDALGEAELRTLERLGVWRVIRGLPKGLDTRVSSSTLSKNEGRALTLASIVLGSASLWVLDTPLDGMSRKAASQRLDAIIDGAAGRTLIVSLDRIRSPDRFDRVLLLRRGKVRFDGTPQELEARKAVTT